MRTFKIVFLSILLMFVSYTYAGTTAPIKASDHHGLADTSSLVAKLFSQSSVNLNTADKKSLVSLKGIGSKKAAAIIKYRKKHGPFKSIEDLKNVEGFGSKSVTKLLKDNKGKIQL